MATMISAPKLRRRVLVGGLVFAGLVVGVQPTAVAGTRKSARAEGSDSDPVVVVNPRRGPIGTAVQVIGRCGPPLRVITETFHRPANLEVPGQPALEGSDPHLYTAPDRDDIRQFSGDFTVPATLFDPDLYREVPVLPGWYVVDAHCYGPPGPNAEVRALFCVPDCPRLSWGGAMGLHFAAATFRLGNFFQLLTTVIPPPIATTTTALPRARTPQPAPPPATDPPTQPELTTTTLCKNGKPPPQC